MCLMRKNQLMEIIIPAQLSFEILDSLGAVSINLK